MGCSRPRARDLASGSPRVARAPRSLRNSQVPHEIACAESRALVRCESRSQSREAFMAIVGYARVSTRDQDHAGQVAALKAAGCEQVFTEKASGARSDRPQLARALRKLDTGDVLMVVRLDRLARS